MTRSEWLSEKGSDPLEASRLCWGFRLAGEGQTPFRKATRHVINRALRLWATKFDMTQGWHFVVNHHWWAWNNARVHQALALALAACLGETVHQKLLENRRVHEKPGSLEDLSGWEFMRRDSNHTKRVVNGGNQTTLQFLLGLSTTLGIPLTELLPDQTTLIRNMTLELSGPALSLADATVYAAFRKRRKTNTTNSLGTAEFLAMREEPDFSHFSVADLGNALNRVIFILGPVLGAIDQSMELKKA